jgi:DNA polymerase-3 subunit beta
MTASPALDCTTERAALLKALAAATRVVEKRTTIPILNNVRLVVGNGRLSLTGTDLDISIDTAADADVKTPGTITVPAHTFKDIVQKLPDGSQVTLQGDAAGGSLAVKAGRSRFKLQALAAEDFPELVLGDVPTRFTLAADTLSLIIDRTAFAISTEETRYYLNGIHLEAAEDGLTAVATDGHRLARYVTALPDGAAGMPGIILPRKTVIEITRLLSGQKEPVTVEMSATKIRLTFSGTPATPGAEGLPTVLASKLIDGTFPDYRRVIPQGNSRVFRVETSAFAAAVDRVGTISSERGRAVKFAFGKDAVALTVTNPDAGSATDEVEATLVGGEAGIEIGFNGRYMQDILAAHGGDATLIKLNDPGSPTLITAEGDDAATFVLMPMRV